jgi:UDP-glucose 4-epimerase
MSEKNSMPEPVAKFTALVTGGAGFIGTHVSRELIKTGAQVIILDDLSGGFEENIPDNAIFIRGSINDHHLVNEIFDRYQIDYVYHLAAYAAEGLSHFIRRFNYNNNLIGSINLINAAVNHQVKCFVFTSSIAVYGKAQLPMREDMVPQPEDPYGIAKLAVEYDLKAAHEMFGLPYIIFRPHNVYGEYQNIGDKYRNVVGIFMNQLLTGESLSIFGDGKQTRAFSYIGDIAPVIASSVLVPSAIGEVFNIGADQAYSVKELAKAVCEAMGEVGKINYIEARNEVLHAYSDHSKIANVFGFQRQTSLQDGLTKMALWVKSHGARSSKPFDLIEIEKQLPPAWKQV